MLLLNSEITPSVILVAKLMKIAFFELEDWKKPFLKMGSKSHEMNCLRNAPM
jgi:hypothetical protein